MVATAAYLWSKDQETVCYAPINGDWSDGDSIVTVSDRFRDILKIWWTYAVADFIRSGIALIAIAAKSKCIAYLYQGLFLNDLLGIAALIMVHVYRLQYSGKFCAGDFLENQVPTPGYLVDRGKYLVGLVIYSWVGLFTYFCVMGCLLTAASRRNAIALKGKY